MDVRYDEPEGTITIEDVARTPGRTAAMKWPSPTLLIALLLITAAKIINLAAIRAILVAALFLVGCLIAADALARKAWNRWQIGIAAVVGAVVIDWLAASLIVGPGLVIVAFVLLVGQQEGRSLFHRMSAPLAPYLPLGQIRRWAFPPSTVSVEEPDHAMSARSAIVRDLVLVFVIAFGIRGVWVLVIPPWQAPDEAVHYLYTAHIIEQSEIPHAAAGDDRNYPPEVLMSRRLTLFGELSGGGLSPTHELAYLPIIYDYGTARAYEGSDRERRWPGPRTDYPPLYFLYSAVPYWFFRHGPVISRLFAVRFASVLLGALSCIFAYLTAYELRRERRWGIALGLAMALMPMYVFITAVANNDAAVDFAAAVLIWLIVRIYQSDRVSRSLALVTGVTGGLALLTKPTILPLLLVAGIMILVKALPATRFSWRSLPSRIVAVALYGISVGLVYSPWIIIRYHYFREVRLLFVPFTSLFRLLTGDTAVSASAPPLLSLAPHMLAVSRFSFWSYLLFEKSRGPSYFGWLLVRSFWGDFGWLDAPLPNRIYLLIVAFCVIAGVGFVMQIIDQPAQRRVAFLLLGLLVVQTVFLFVGVDYFQGFVRTGKDFGLQGRYFFPILAPLLLALLSGWDYLWRGNPLGLRIAIVGMVALQAVGLATILNRYYGVVIG